MRKISCKPHQPCYDVAQFPRLRVFCSLFDSDFRADAGGGFFPPVSTAWRNNMMVHIENLPEDGSDAAEQVNDFLSPGQVDQFTRQALQFCWMALPKERKNVEELEQQFRRIVER